MNDSQWKVYWEKYSISFCKSASDVLSFLECSEEQLEEVKEIISKGFEHGLAGWYADNDFASDADFCYGVGSQIQTLEEQLEIDDGTIFDFYCNAHSYGLIAREGH